MDTKNTTSINIPYPEAGELRLKISAAACRLNIRPTDEDVWVTGTYYDPTGMMPLRIAQGGGSASITFELNPSNVFSMGTGIPQLNLALGKAHPYELTIEGGAGGNLFDFTGLPLRRLIVSHGAGKIETDFAQPNPEKMELLKLSVGAGSIEAKNLANANFGEMLVEGGVDSCSLDFGGALQRNGYVRISAGLSSVDVKIPATIPARVTSSSILGAPSIDGGFVQREHAYWTPRGLAGEVPMLDIYNSAAFGRLSLWSVEPARDAAGVAAS